MPAIPRKEREFIRREQEILEAALSLFEGPDWEQVTVAEIASKAEIGKGTVYKHFSCKEDIYARLALNFHSDLLQAFHQIDHSLPVDQIFRKIIKISFQKMLDDPANGHVSVYCKRGDFLERLNPALQSAFVELDSQFDAFISEVLSQGIKLGLIPDRPIEQLMVGLEATFDGALHMIWNQQVNMRFEMDISTFLDSISEFMVAGLMGMPR